MLNWQPCICCGEQKKKNLSDWGREPAGPVHPEATFVLVRVHLQLLHGHQAGDHEPFPVRDAACSVLPAAPVRLHGCQLGPPLPDSADRRGGILLAHLDGLGVWGGVWTGELPDACCQLGAEQGCRWWWGRCYRSSFDRPLLYLLPPVSLCPVARVGIFVFVKHLLISPLLSVCPGGVCVRFYAGQGPPSAVSPFPFSPIIALFPLDFSVYMLMWVFLCANVTTCAYAHVQVCIYM